MIVEIGMYLKMDLVSSMFVKPALNFTYDGFEWVRPFSETGMNVLLGLMLIAAVCIFLGIGLRFAGLFFGVSQLYLLLLDKSLFNNHLYLFALLAILLSFTNADKGLSLFSPSFKKKTVPRFQYLIFQIQFTIVYFYGGIVKLKHDWLVHHQPIKSGIEVLAERNPGFEFLNAPLLIALFAYAGLFIDLVCPILLWFKKTRITAICLLILFNIINLILFQDIGYFPIAMIGGLILFLGMEKLGSGEKKKNNAQVSRFLLIGFSAYFLFQLLFPLRGFLLPNDQDLTTIGNRFSWRMKADTRYVDEAYFKIVDEAKPSDTTYIDFIRFVNVTQVNNLLADPRSMNQFAKHITQEGKKVGMQNPRLFGTIRISYNGRPINDYINRTTDLSNVTSLSPFQKIKWIYPLDKN